MAETNISRLSQRRVQKLKPVRNPRTALVKWSKRSITWFLLSFFSFIFLFPILWMFITSLKDVQEVLIVPPLIVPSEFKWENYPETTNRLPFFRYLGNTIYLTVVNLIGTLVSCSLAAYGFSRLKWPGRDTLFVSTLMTMMIPFPVLMIPLYSIFRSMGWVGTFMPLWVPSFFGTAYFIFLLRQFFLTIPKDLSEAARIDGCDEFMIYYRIILPLSKPALMVVALFSFLYVWNDLIGPLIYLTNQSQYTLTIGLQDYANQAGGASYNILMAAGVMVTVPVIVLYFFAQKTFVEGIALTGLKH